MNTMPMKSEDILLHDDDNNLPWLKSQLRTVTDEDNKQQQDCFADCGGVLPTNLFVEEEEEDSNDGDGDNNKTKTNDSNNNSKDNHRTSSLSTAMVAIISPGNSRTGTARINKNDNTTDRMLWRRSSSNSLINIPTPIIDNNNQNQNHLRFTCPTSLTSPITTRPTTTAATALVVPPTTPRGLFASFSGTQTSSEMNNMWQYDATVSPRTTDAVQMMATATSSAAAWTSSSSPPLPLSQQQENRNNMSATTMMIPLVPSLVHHGCGEGAVVVAVANATPTTSNRTTNDIPSIISVPVVSSFYESFFDNDEDDVSLLADNPDEDDDNVLPIVTYDVLHNTGIFAEEEEDEEDK
mmetsp:Transcript_52125/g.58236  ORF Transcript_52125/g.58236 Transcript_52125/m.58236 type:complete len:352 (+) Transcript_52125:357-1412(+)